MLQYDQNYNTFYDWFQRNTKDSYKYADKLGKLGAKIQSLSDKINSLQQIKIEITEKSLENDEKSFTLKVVGNLNLNNKGFVKDIAEKFASILDDYKSKKIEELSKELDSTIEEMKNVFPAQVTIYGSASSGNIDCMKTWIGDLPNSKMCNTIGVDSNGQYILNEDVVKTVIDWREDSK